MSELITHYWNIQQLEVNFLIALNLLGSLILGFMVGYERSYQGRAAGMRTYGLVSMTSCALTVFSGYSQFWFGGDLNMVMGPDPTRVIQGIVTGIGFLCAGVIMKDGFNISGLSTAASIWMCCAMGILVGVGFYAAGILIAILSILSMSVFSLLEQKLPYKTTIFVKLKYAENYEPKEDSLRKAAADRGYIIPKNGISVCMDNDSQEWQFMATAGAKSQAIPLTELSRELSKFPGVTSFSISPAKL